jgi:hypothetical protein
MIEMRTACFSLLILVTSYAFGANGVRIESPLPFNASILTSGAACVEGINRAQVVTDGPGGARYHWTIAHGVIVDGENTSAIEFTPIDRDFTVLSVFVEWGGIGTTLHAAIPVFGPPAILQQPQSAAVLPGGSATLTVVATNEALDYEWFEGRSGDTSKRVAVGVAAFKTPPLTKSAAYWVRVSGGCGAVASQTAMVMVGAKRRSAGR